MDLLSDLLTLVRPRIVGAGGFDLAGAWAVGFPQHQGIKCYAVASGQCWLVMEGMAEPAELKEGDCVLLPHGRPFRLASEPAVAPVPYSSLTHIDDVRSWNGGGECLIVGGHFALAATQRQILVGMLAPIVHLSSDDDRAALRWSLDQMRHELTSGRPGASLMAQQLAQMMLIHAFRRQIEERHQPGASWLFALADPQLRRAIAAIHADPARRWTVVELAREAGASRSGFSRRFTERVGQPPIEYVTTWRMLLAADRLARGTEPVATIAQSLGYGADSAFGAAFRRVMGCSPREHARTAREPALA